MQETSRKDKIMQTKDYSIVINNLTKRQMKSGAKILESKKFKKNGRDTHISWWGVDGSDEVPRSEILP